MTKTCLIRASLGSGIQNSGIGLRKGRAGQEAGKNQYQRVQPQHDILRIRGVEAQFNPDNGEWTMSARTLVLIAAILLSPAALAQKPTVFSNRDGAIRGHDPVAYFDQKRPG